MNEVEKLKRRWQKEDAAQIEGAIAALLQHSQGRKFLWWLLEIGRVGTQPYAHNALQTSFNCGELNVGQRILDRIIFTNPEGYVTMMKESASDRRKRDDDLNRATDADRGRGHFAGEPGPDDDPDDRTNDGTDD